jgi:hypothetical protein
MDTKRLADAFASKLKVVIRSEDNSQLLRELESKLPTRLPPSFESLLSRCSDRLNRHDLPGSRR